MHLDYDRYIALFLSIIIIILSAGISLVASFIYVISIAKNKKCLTNNKAVTLLVLGKKLKNGLPDNEYMSRLSRAAGMLNNNPDRTVYILGGVTGVENIAESTSGKTILLSFGIDSNIIFLEKDSSHTLENLKNFYSLFNQKNQKILLVTNRYHMARSIMMAKGFKINATSCPAEDSFSYTFLNMGKVVIEAFYVNFYLAGKYWAILTNNNKVLDRISTINR